MKQEKLWHDALSDALRDVVVAAGGPKKVGTALWPTKPAPAAARLLNHCLDDERSEKLALEEVEAILKLGRECDCHVGMHYLTSVIGYQQTQPVDPESERDRLRREYIEATRALQGIAQRIERMGEASA